MFTKWGHFIRVNEMENEGSKIIITRQSNMSSLFIFESKSDWLDSPLEPSKKEILNGGF